MTGKSNCASVAPSLSNSSKVRSDRKSTRLNSSHLGISYAVFCLKKKYQFQILLVVALDGVGDDARANRVHQAAPAGSGVFGVFFFNLRGPPGDKLFSLTRLSSD